jgi:hypothetical protein
MNRTVSKKGETIRDVRYAYEGGITIEQISRETGKSIKAFKCSQRRINIVLKTESTRKEWGSLKQKIVNMDTYNYTVKELSEMLRTTRYTIYALCTRHDMPFKRIYE